MLVEVKSLEKIRNRVLEAVSTREVTIQGVTLQILKMEKGILLTSGKTAKQSRN